MNQTTQAVNESGGHKTVAVLAVKRFDAAKSRLAVSIDPASRRNLARAMLQDTLAQLADCDEIDHLVIASSEPEMAQLAPNAEVVARDADVSHSAAAAAGILAALAHGATTVLLLPGDCPLVRAAEIDSLITATRADGLGVCVVPDHTGTGTNALVLTPPTAIAPAFGPDSRLRHLQLAHEAGMTAATATVHGLSLDIDNDTDFEDLANRLSEPGHVALHAENAIAEIMLDRHRLPGGMAR